METMGSHVENRASRYAGRALATCATVLLSIVATPQVAHAATVPTSSCALNGQPNGGYTCNLYPSANGVPSSISDLTFVPTPTTGYMVLLTAPNVDQTNQANW